MIKIYQVLCLVGAGPIPPFFAVDALIIEEEGAVERAARYLPRMSASCHRLSAY